MFGEKACPMLVAQALFKSQPTQLWPKPTYVTSAEDPILGANTNPKLVEPTPCKCGSQRKCVRVQPKFGQACAEPYRNPPEANPNLIEADPKLVGAKPH